jgi:outer membrane immunogenic protein
MRRLATIGTAFLSLAAFSGAANPADLPVKAHTKVPPVPAVYNWSGFYIGLNGGGASSHKCWTIFSNNNLPVGPTSEGCHDATGALVGGQAGYRWQFTNWVFGLEAQGDWANLKGSNANQAVRIPATNATRIDAIGLFTGQVGYAWNNVLWYAKGGAAAVSDKYSTFFTATNVVYNEARETRWGAVVGTGFEFGFVPNWSVALEYDHLFMGSKDVTFPASAIAVTRSDSIRQDVDMGTIRVNYRFGGPVVARY